MALPNLRKLFLPDPGMMLIDADLERADAQIVAWEADDASLKEAFRLGIDIHSRNAQMIYQDDPEVANASLEDFKHNPKLRFLRNKRAKNGVHAVNYGVQPRTLAATLECTERDAKNFMDRWFAAHPGVKAWHNRIEYELRARRYVQNIWGFKRWYKGRLDIPAALGWLGQSTVAITINKGLLNIEDNLPNIDLLLQVHDSLVMQTPLENCPAIYPSIKQQMLIPIPYDDPLTIGVTIQASPISWGDVEDV